MTTEKAYQNMSDLGEDLTSLRNDVAKLSTSVAELVRDQASSAASTFVGAVDQARQKVSETAGDAQVRMRSTAGDLEATIERNPLTAIMVALVTGLILGLFTRATK